MQRAGGLMHPGRTASLAVVEGGTLNHFPCRGDIFLALSACHLSPWAARWSVSCLHLGDVRALRRYAWDQMGPDMDGRLTKYPRKRVGGDDTSSWLGYPMFRPPVGLLFVFQTKVSGWGGLYLTC